MKHFEDNKKMMKNKITNWFKSLFFREYRDLGFEEKLNKKGIGVYY